MVKAVLFGSLSSLTSLVDLERRAFNRTFDDFGVDLRWSEADYDGLLKTTGRFSGPTEAVDALEGVVSEAFYQDLEMNFRDFIDSATLTLHPWSKAALDALTRRGTKVALVSGAERQTVLRVLAAVFSRRSSTVFDVVTARETAPEDPKPSPGLFRAALEELHVNARDVFAIEATHHGIVAAKIAGIRTAGFKNRYLDAQQLAHADFELGSDLRKTILHFQACKLKQQVAAE